MKKPLTYVFAIAILAIVGFAVIRLSDNAAAPPGPQGRTEEQAAGGQTRAPEAVVFDLQYRALTGPDDVLSYRSFWGFGASPPTDVPFVEAVRKQVGELDLVYNGSLQDRPWSAVELKEKKPVALYFDLDADGKLSENEKILPAPSSKPKPEQEFAFITPDFLMRREDGREIPFRVMLVANAYGGDRMNYMWSPCCILEGQAVLAGAATRLFLYGDGFSGSFNTFGSCSFAMVPLLQKNLEGFLSRVTLSSLIRHKGTFYRLSLEGSHEKDKTLQLKFQEDTSPTGRTAVRLQGKEPLKARLTRTTITGAEDSTIRFNMNDGPSVIPVGDYQLASGTTCYGVGSDDQWQVSFEGGPAFTIGKDETAGIELGDLALSVSAVDERERYNSDVREKSAYAEGTSIYLTPRIKGKAGEVYLRFSQPKKAGGNEWTDVKPHVTILHADGKKVASADMEYG